MMLSFLTPIVLSLVRVIESSESFVDSCCFDKLVSFRPIVLRAGRLMDFNPTSKS